MSASEHAAERDRTDTPLGGDAREEPHLPDASGTDGHGVVGESAARSRRDRELALKPADGGPRTTSGTEAGARTSPAPNGPFIALLFTLATMLALLAAVAATERPWADGVTPLVLWALFAAGSNALPAPSTPNVYLSMSSPVNIAIALLFTPATASVLVATAAVSIWELRRETTVIRASFNRIQIGLSTAVASALLHVTEEVEVLTTVLAVSAYHGCNWLLVALAERTARGRPFSDALSDLVPRQPVAAATYLVLGTMGIVLALAYERIGAWSVALLMLPLLSARHAVTVSLRLEELERERRRFADRIVDERDRDRVRIAADIHDAALQTLAAVRLDAETASMAARDGDAPRSAAASRRVMNAIDTVIDNLRAAIFDLRHRSLGTDGLVPTLQRFARGFGHANDVVVEVETIGGPWNELPPSTAMLLFDCCQEGIVNAHRHADASTIHVRLRRTGSVVEVVVADDGSAAIGVAGAPGSGLTLLKQKLSYVGGTLDLSLNPAGSQLRVEVELGAHP